MTKGVINKVWIIDLSLSCHHYTWRNPAWINGTECSSCFCVLQELVVALSHLVVQYESNFCTVALQFIEEEKNYTVPSPANTAGTVVQWASDLICTGHTKGQPKSQGTPGTIFVPKHLYHLPRCVCLFWSANAKQNLVNNYITDESFTNTVIQEIMWNFVKLHKSTQDTDLNI